MSTPTAAPVHLAWRSREHYSARALPCRLCGGDAHMRDEQGRPCHKTCAEAEATRARGATVAAYAAGERPARSAPKPRSRKESRS